LIYYIIDLDKDIKLMLDEYNYI